jgi:hypothetical protein
LNSSPCGKDLKTYAVTEYRHMNNSELRKLAIKHLNSKNVQSIKKQLCEKFTDTKNKNDCITAFDKSFIQSFMNSRMKKH